jgi:ElaB/YqjD/DUF883 family membrane-anchored ribosome-binding protein
MEPENFTSGPSVENRTADDNTGSVSNLEEVKNIIAKKLHDVAEELSEKAESRDLQPLIGDYGKQAAHWLDQSAEYIQDFDYHELNAKVRGYVKENPGFSVLIAGVAGLILGTFVRRR